MWVIYSKLVDIYAILLVYVSDLQQASDIYAILLVYVTDLQQASWHISHLANEKTAIIN